MPSTGEAAGFWWGELTPDQRSADAWSLVYDSGPLPEDVEILGFPKALLRGSADAPLANWFARLSDVAPDGQVTLVTGAGALGGAAGIRVAPGAARAAAGTYPLDVEMHFTSWVFPKGHRVRLAVSNALWPMIWPTPYAMTTQLSLGGTDGSRLVLPVIPREARPGARLRRPGALDRGRRRAVHAGAPGRASGRSAATRSSRRPTGTGAAPRRRSTPGGPWPSPSR